jgi:hypothetical protein
LQSQEEGSVQVIGSITNRLDGLSGGRVEDFSDFLERSKRLLQALSSSGRDIVERIFAFKFRREFGSSSDIPLSIASNQQRALIPCAKGVLQVMADFFVGGLDEGKIAEASKIFESS